MVLYFCCTSSFFFPLLVYDWWVRRYNIFNHRNVRDQLTHLNLTQVMQWPKLLLRYGSLSFIFVYLSLFIWYYYMCFTKPKIITVEMYYRALVNLSIWICLAHPEFMEVFGGQFLFGLIVQMKLYVTLVSIRKFVMKETCDGAYLQRQSARDSNIV